MATYVMGDVHGDIARYHTMLENISLSPADRLYILGDVIDRKPGGIELLQTIMPQRNIHLLLGNHEQMLLDTFQQAGISTQARDLWMRNEGGVTAHGLLNCSIQEQESILSYLQTCPLALTITVNEIAYYLVHGSPAETSYDRLWRRFSINQDYSELVGNAVILFAHTPTWYYQPTPHGAKATILSGHGYLGLDCGCGHLRSDAQLACLRLDDGCQFYS